LFEVHSMKTLADIEEGLHEAAAKPEVQRAEGA
jgi:hypothetical protein